MPIEDEAADDSASDAENELDDDEPTPTSRRHHAEDEKLIPAFEFLAAVGGKALTVRSVTSFEIDDPDFQPLWISRIDQMDADEMTRLIDGSAPPQFLASALNRTIWELQTAIVQELPPGADELVDAWRSGLRTKEQIVDEYEEDEDDEQHTLDRYFGGDFSDDGWGALDLQMRPSLFLATGRESKFEWMHSGKKLVRTIRTMISAVEEGGETMKVKCLLRHANSGAAAAPKPRAPRGGSHGGSRGGAGRPEKPKKVLLLLHLGTKQTEQSGTVKFFRTDAADPLMVIKDLADLPVVDAEDPVASVAATVDFAYKLLVQAGCVVPSRTGEGVPPQSFKPAGTSARQGESAREIDPVKLLQDVTPKKIRGVEESSYTHELVLCFPHGSQPVTGSALGLRPPLFDFTPVIKPEANATAAGSKAQRTAAAQGSKSDTLHAIRVACVAFRQSNLGQPSSGTPPFAKIMVSGHFECFLSLSTCLVRGVNLPVPTARADPLLQPRHLPVWPGN